MASKRSSKKSRSQAAEFLQKPRGVIHPRVQKVGPEHFGIVCVDCAKARSKWMLTDFYGKVLVPPTEIAHNRVELEAAVAQVRAAMTEHGLLDALVAVERTGRYHHPVKNVFAKAGFETRLVHPFATKQFRQPANPDNKTDDTDLAAIQRAAVNGFARLESTPPEAWRQMQLSIRHRRDLVNKASALACQNNVFAWAQNAAAPDLAVELHRQIALAYEDDRQRKTQQFSRSNATSPIG